MHPIELIRGFMNDLWRLPFVFQLGLLGMVGVSAWQWHKDRKRKQLQRAAVWWPTHRARVVWAQVSDRTKEGRHGPVYWEGILTYSYTVPGHEVEVGEYRRKFYDEEMADRWARGLRDTFVNVRVDPTDVRRSAWLEDAKDEAMHASLTLPRGHDNSLGWRGVVLIVLFAVSGTGAVISLMAQISCLLGRPLITAANAVAFFGMHLGAIACAIGLQLASPGSWKRFQRWRMSSDGQTSTLAKLFGTYCLVVFFYSWVRMAAHPESSGRWPVLMFSAVWMVFYAGSAESCWLVLRGSEANNSAN